MKTERFKSLSNSQNLDDLVSRTLAITQAHEKVNQNTVYSPQLFSETIQNTVHGNLLYMFSSHYFPDSVQKVWSYADSPQKVQSAIPGLDEFTVEGKFKGAKITELHDMGYSKNKYAGEIFMFDNDRMRWGMTNHPVKNNNQFDIPHNVVYNVSPYQAGSIFTLGMMYAPTGSSPFISGIKKDAAAKVFGKLAVYAVVDRLSEMLERRIILK